MSPSPYGLASFLITTIPTRKFSKDQTKAKMKKDLGSKQGWGFAKEGVKLDTTQQKEKSTNIWEQQNQDLIVIPDLEDENNDTSAKLIAQPPTLKKVQDFSEVQKIAKQSSLPQPEDGVDFSSLISTLRPADEIAEKDELWEFQQLKNEIYEMVSSMYGGNDMDDLEK